MEKCLSNDKTITLFISNNFSVFELEKVPTNKKKFLLTHCFNRTFPWDLGAISHYSNLVAISTHSTGGLERFRSPFAHSIYQPGIHEEHNSLLKRAMSTQPTQPKKQRNDSKFHLKK